MPNIERVRLRKKFLNLYYNNFLIISVGHAHFLF
jgi:hypothetical protein